MRTLLPLGIAVSLAGPVACGPAPAPDVPKTQAQPVQPGTAAVAAAAPYDLSPVAEPSDVFGVLRWRNPAATLSALTGCAGLPPQLAEGGARSGVEEMLGEMVGRTVDRRQLGAVVALDAPVQAVAALDSRSRRARPVAAVSIGLVSLERARGAVEASSQLTEIASGMWRIGGRERTGATCAIAASAGSTPARLICGDRERDLSTLGPYLARTLPTAPPDAHDIHGELRFAPLSDKFGGLARAQLRGLPILMQSQLSIGEPRFDRALVEAASGIQDELTALIGDADKLTLDLRADSSTCLSVSAALDLRGKSSWLAGTLADRPERAGAPPPIFWRVPKDSEAVFFARGADPARYSEILKTLRALLEGWLTKEKIGRPADRKAVAELLAMPLDKETNSVSASGGDAQQATLGGSDRRQLIDALMGAWIGWKVVGIDQGPDVSIKYLKDFVSVYNRPGLLRVLKKELGDDAKLLPSVRIVRAPRDLGKRALAVEVKVKNIPVPEPDKPSAKPKTMTLTMHILLMGEDKTTWIAFGMDKAELLKRLATVKSGAPDAGTLAARPGLEHLKGARLMSGGFITLAPITRLFAAGVGVFAPLRGGGVPADAQKVMRLLTNLPHKAETPIFFASTSRGGNAPHGELSINVPKPALEDIGAIVFGGMKIAAGKP